MKAIILAAGVGKRIRAATGNRPKCLLEFGGRSLLVRYLDALLAVGVKSADLVVGHRQDLLRDAVGESHRGLAIRYVVNDQYRRGSLYSLWLARGSFDDDLLIMDFFFSSRRRHTRSLCDWTDVCSSDLRPR